MSLVRLSKQGTRSALIKVHSFCSIGSNKECHSFGYQSKANRRYGYGEVVKGWKGGEWCRPVMRDVGDASADMVVHAVAMAFRENRGSNYVCIQ
ncbi:hypothetical protein Tco_1381165, partial [Tanacetum coccineum]